MILWRIASLQQRKAAAASIRGQLEAFKRNDWKTAVSYQSPELRRKFGSTERFRRSIQHNYPQFASYRSITFGRALVAGKSLQFEVRLVGNDRMTIGALYILKQHNGKYLVEGVIGNADSDQMGASV